MTSLARHLTDEVAAAAEPKASLTDIIEWVARLSDAQYAEVQAETNRLGRVPEGMARELYLGRKVYPAASGNPGFAEIDAKPGISCTVGCVVVMSASLSTYTPTPTGIVAARAR